MSHSDLEQRLSEATALLRLWFDCHGCYGEVGPDTRDFLSRTPAPAAPCPSSCYAEQVGINPTPAAPIVTIQANTLVTGQTVRLEADGFYAARVHPETAPAAESEPEPLDDTSLWPFDAKRAPTAGAAIQSLRSALDNMLHPDTVALRSAKARIADLEAHADSFTCNMCQVLKERVAELEAEVKIAWEEDPLVPELRTRMAQARAELERHTKEGEDPSACVDRALELLKT